MATNWNRDMLQSNNLADLCRIRPTRDVNNNNTNHQTAASISSGEKLEDDIVELHSYVAAFLFSHQAFVSRLLERRQIAHCDMWPIELIDDYANMLDEDDEGYEKKSRSASTALVVLRAKDKATLRGARDIVEKELISLTLKMTNAAFEMATKTKKLTEFVVSLEKQQTTAAASASASSSDNDKSIAVDLQRREIIITGERAAVKQAHSLLDAFLEANAVSTRVLDELFDELDIRYLHTCVRDDIRAFEEEMNAEARVRMKIEIECDDGEEGRLRVTASEQWHGKVLRFLRDKLNGRLESEFALNEPELGKLFDTPEYVNDVKNIERATRCVIAKKRPTPTTTATTTMAKTIKPTPTLPSANSQKKRVQQSRSQLRTDKKERLPFVAYYRAPGSSFRVRFVVTSGVEWLSNDELRCDGLLTSANELLEPVTSFARSVAHMSGIVQRGAFNRLMDENDCMICKGEVYSTESGQLKQQAGVNLLYHAIFDDTDGYDYDDSYTQCILNECTFKFLEACENRKMRTLALPAYDLAPELGNEDSARTILNAISAYFTQQKARSSITTLHVCNDIFGAFVKCLLAEASQPNTCISMDESNESYAFMADLELSDDDEYDDDIVDADGFYLGRTTRYAELSSSDDDDDDFNYTFDYPESLPSLGLLDLHEERGASPDGRTFAGIDRVQKTSDRAYSAQVNGSVTLSVYMGCITESTDQCIVNPTDGSLQAKGLVSKALVKHFGAHLTDSIRGLQMTSAHNGVLVAHTGRMTRPFAFAHVEVANGKTRDLLARALAAIDEHSYTSVTVPLIGTGVSRRDSHECIVDTLEAVIRFATTASPSSLVNINVCVHHTQQQLFDEFVAVLTNRSSSSPSPSSTTSPSTSTSVTAATAAGAAVVFCRLALFAANEANLAKARAGLAKLAERDFKREALSNAFFQQLDADTKLSIEQACAREHTTCELDEAAGHLVVKGRADCIIKTCGRIFTLMSKHYADKTTRAEAECIALKVQWQFLVGGAKWTPHNIFVNDQLEKAYSSHQTAVSTTKAAKAAAGSSVERVEFLGENDRIYVAEPKLLVQYEQADVSRRQQLRRVLLDEQHALNVRLPASWTPNSDLNLIALDATSAEFASVVKLFADGGLSAAHKNLKRVVRVERVQNKRLFVQYMAHKEEFEKRYTSQQKQLQLEMTLFHGTRQESIDKIWKNGFNRAFAGRNGTKYGKGVYFAKSAAYSHQFTDLISGKKHGQMFASKVLVGQIAIGDPTMHTPPERVDTSVDALSTPQIFVIYHDAQAYPDYLLTYEGNS